MTEQQKLDVRELIALFFAVDIERVEETTDKVGQRRRECVRHPGKMSGCGPTNREHEKGHRDIPQRSNIG